MYKGILISSTFSKSSKKYHTHTNHEWGSKGKPSIPRAFCSHSLSNEMYHESIQNDVIDMCTNYIIFVFKYNKWKYN